MKFAQFLTGNEMNAHKPNIYDYRSLSIYLKAYCDYKKSVNSRWSLGTWARKLNVTGSGTLSNFLSGRRLPSQDTLDLIKQDIGLSEYEAEFFDALAIVSSKSADPLLKQAAKVLLQERSVGKDYLEMSDEEFKLISSPLGMVLIEATKLKGYKPDTSWIKKKTAYLKQYDDAEIDKTFDLLEKAGLIGMKQTYYKTPKDIDSETLKSYYEQALVLNRNAIRSIPREERHLNSITFCCDSKRLPELKEAIHEFSKRLMQEFDQDQGDVVYQLHTQLVPHLKA